VHIVYKLKNGPVKTIPRMRKERIKKNGGGDEFNYNEFDKL
jgi:hypothetical protein